MPFSQQEKKSNTEYIRNKSSDIGHFIKLEENKWNETDTFGSKLFT